MSHSNSGKQKEESKSKYCHQCRRNDRGRVVYCSKCGTKQYCVRCIANRYSKMVEASFVEACPACRGICNCSECQKPKVRKTARANDNTTLPISAADRPSHEYMKQQVEIWKSRLATQGHSISPETREMLRAEVYNFENKFFPKEGPSSSSRP